MSIQEAVPVQLALEELAGTLQQLQAQASARSNQDEGVYCMRFWQPALQTYTYHTHVVVNDVLPAILDEIAGLFFNAYSQPQHGWYSQFRRGCNLPLPIATTVTGAHQMGVGLFDFGVPGLRAYHVLFSLLSPGENQRAVVLRTVSDPMPSQGAARQVFLLPPTGDLFVRDGARLHWHHICTTTGIGLLPGVADRWFMNLLRFLHLDHTERRTYLEEGAAFIRYVKDLSRQREVQET